MAKLAKFHDAKRFVADQIAACVLIEPSLESGCSKLDRELIDPNLRSVLAIASYTVDCVAMSRRVISILGSRYWYQLICLVDQLDHRGNFAFVTDFDKYVETLFSMVESERARMLLEAERIEINHGIAKTMAMISGRF